MLNLVKRVMTDESGASAAEYGLLVSLIAVAIIIGVTAFGAGMNAFFAGLSGKLGF